MMIIAPRSRLTRSVMTSRVVYVALGSLYVALLAVGMSRADRDKFRDFMREPSPERLADMMSDPAVMTAGWVHYLAFDLYVGRAIWQESVDADRPARLPLVLTMLAGPSGLLLHIVRRT